MKSILILIVSITISSLCFGQTEKLVLTLNPLSFLEPQAGFTPGIGYNINKNWAIYSDVGFIFYEGFPNERNNEQTIKGYKLKPAIRFNLTKQKSLNGLFFELEGLIKKTTTFRTARLPIFDASGNFVYNYLGGWKVIRNIYGASAKAGYRLYFDKAKRWGNDMYVGIGLRTGNERLENLPNGSRLGPNGRKYEAFGGRFFPGNQRISLPAGVKLFYTF